MLIHTFNRLHLGNTGTYVERKKFQIPPELTAGHHHLAKYTNGISFLFEKMREKNNYVA